MIFDNYSLRDTGTGNEGITALADLIAKGFSGDYTLLKVEAFAKTRWGPTGLAFSRDDNEHSEGGKESSPLQFEWLCCTAFTENGNALRTIDDWYAPDSVRIAVEPFGSVTHQGVAMRKSKMTFTPSRISGLLKEIPSRQRRNTSLWPY